MRQPHRKTHQYGMHSCSSFTPSWSIRWNKPLCPSKNGSSIMDARVFRSALSAAAQSACIARRSPDPCGGPERGFPFHAQVLPYSKAPAVYIPEVAVFCAGISLVKLLQKHPLHMVVIAAQVDSQLPSPPRLPLMKGGQIFNGHNRVRPGAEIPATLPASRLDSPIPLKMPSNPHHTLCLRLPSESSLPLHHQP